MMLGFEMHSNPDTSTNHGQSFLYNKPEDEWQPRLQAASPWNVFLIGILGDIHVSGIKMLQIDSIIKLPGFHITGL